MRRPVWAIFLLFKGTHLSPEPEGKKKMKTADFPAIGAEAKPSQFPVSPSGDVEEISGV